MLRAQRQEEAAIVFLHLSSFAMRWTVPVPIPSDLATFKIPMPFASCFRTLRSVVLSIFGRPSFTPWATARLRPALMRWRITHIQSRALVRHQASSILPARIPSGYTFIN